VNCDNHRTSAIDGTLERMTAWQEYQERAAYFFHLLGMDVHVDEHVIGARGEHDVDVVVRAGQAGIGQTWIVECKLWRRRVSKLHVAALANIVQDVGADRGILLSETGFQPGAVRLASFSNITLTSLTELTAVCCVHWGTVVKTGPGRLACTACGQVQPTD
jgi:restriction system protein